MAPKHAYFRRVARREFIMSFAVASALCVLSCESDSRTEAIEALSSNTAPVSHVRHSVRLRVVMSEINDLSMTRLPQEMGSSLGQRRRIASIGAIANQLAESSAQLPVFADELDLTNGQRASFIELAGFLHDESRELERIARKGASPRLVRSKLNEMLTTCNACHRLFRDLAPVDSDALEF